MWKALEDVFQRKGMASQLYLRKKLLTMKYRESQLYLRKKLLTMKYRESERIENYFIKFDEVVRELKSVGAKLEDVDIVCHLLLTLPKSFDPIVTALETLEPARLTLEFVKGKLLDHEAKRVNRETTASGETTAVFLTSSKGYNNKKITKDRSQAKINATIVGSQVTSEMSAVTRNNQKKKFTSLSQPARVKVPPWKKTTDALNGMLILLPQIT
ncbi:hypothetical protein QE152_g19157 [Popillia japonica]|uniref:Retrovirus-related Pol polyprotein from transposon TNT 1-94 n=1 Tax=Popillia japonica TaxID=7064 RepID=A0AAW1L4G1_POPJA